MTKAQDEKWHKEVCERDGYVCQANNCKKDFNSAYFFDDKSGKNQFVLGHHIKRKRAFPNLRLVLSNGVCMCKECHDKLHGLCSSKVIINDESSKKRGAKYWGATSAPKSLEKTHKKFWGETKPPIQKAKK